MMIASVGVLELMLAVCVVPCVVALAVWAITNQHRSSATKLAFIGISIAVTAVMLMTSLYWMLAGLDRADADRKEVARAVAERHRADTRVAAATEQAFRKLTEPRIKLDDPSELRRLGAPPLLIEDEAPGWANRPESDYESNSAFTKQLAKQFDADYVLVYKSVSRGGLDSCLKIEQKHVLKGIRKYLQERSKGAVGVFAPIEMSTAELYKQFVQARRLVEEKDRHTIYTLLTFKNDDGGDDLLAQTLQLQQAQRRETKTSTLVLKDGRRIQFAHDTPMPEVIEQINQATEGRSRERNDGKRVTYSDPRGSTTLELQSAPPDWAENPAAAAKGAGYVVVIESGPYSSFGECMNAERRQVVQTARGYIANHVQSDAFNTADGLLGMSTSDLVQRFVLQRSLVRTETTLQGMYTLYTLVKIDKRGGDHLVATTLTRQREQHFSRVGAGALSVLVVVAVAFGLLKADEATRGYYTKRLLIGVPILLVGCLVLLFLSLA